MAIFLFIVIALLILGFSGTVLFLSSFLNSEYIVKIIEENFNCRAQVGNARLKLFKLFSSALVEDIHIVTRDEYANKAVPLSLRPEILVPEIYIKKVELRLNLLAILRKKFRVNSFLFSEPLFNMIFFIGGGNNLLPMLQKPEIIDSKPNPDYRDIQDLQEDEWVLNIKNMPLSAKLEIIGIQDGLANLYIKKTGQLLRLNDMQFIISSIEIHPARLDKFNSLDISFEMNLAIIGNNKREIAEFYMSCKQTIKPFLMNGAYDSGIVYNIKIAKGSYIYGTVLSNLLSAIVNALRGAGINLESATIESLQRNARMHITYRAEIITLREKVHLFATSFDFELNPGSWYSIDNNDHYFNGSIIIYRKEVSRIITGIDDFIRGVVPDIETKKVRNRILGPLLKNEKMFIPFTSKGNIKNPFVELGLELPSIPRILKDYVKETFGKKKKKKNL